MLTSIKLYVVFKRIHKNKNNSTNLRSPLKRYQKWQPVEVGYTSRFILKGCHFGQDWEKTCKLHHFVFFTMPFEKDAL